jgi:hypothetical protein
MTNINITVPSGNIIIQSYPPEVTIKTDTRIKTTGEVFTPLSLCSEILNKLPISASDKSKTFIDPSCGNGQFLISIAQQRRCLANIFGVDLMVDNVCDTIVRLYLFRLGFVDSYDHTGHTNTLVIDPGHDPNEHPEFDWLVEQNTFQRQYQYKDVSIVVKIAGMAGDDGLIFRCNGMLFPTIVCANSLTFFKDGDVNGFDELTAEIEYFNNLNSEEVITTEIEEIKVVPESEVVYNEIKHTPVVVSKPVIEIPTEIQEHMTVLSNRIERESKMVGMQKSVNDTKKALANLKKKYGIK